MLALKELRSVDEWNNVLEKSKEGLALVLKHSTTCPISAAAYGEYNKFETDMPKYFLKVQDSRPVSTQIESELGIAHQSPQLFLVKDGKAVWHTSHHSITGKNIGKAVEEITKG